MGLSFLYSCRGNLQENIVNVVRRLGFGRLFFKLLSNELTIMEVKDASKGQRRDGLHALDVFLFLLTPSIRHYLYNPYCILTQPLAGKRAQNVLTCLVIETPEQVWPES